MYKIIKEDKVLFESTSISEIYNHYVDGYITKDDEIICKTESEFCNNHAKVRCCQSVCPAWDNPKLSY